MSLLSMFIGIAGTFFIVKSIWSGVIRWKPGDKKGVWYYGARVVLAIWLLGVAFRILGVAIGATP